MDLTSKIALITGGIKGIGKATALTLASKGANIVLNYRKNSNNDEIALKLQKEIESLGVQVLLAKGDISNEEDVKEIFKLIKDHFGRLDILVNNAGITRDNLIIRTKTEDFNQVIDANLKGTFLCMKYASKIMIKQKYGRIISLSSVTGIIGNPGQANYAASKAGIIGMSKSLAKELGSRHITVSTCGVVPKIKEFASFPYQVNLAISLHSAIENKRQELMPISRAYDLNTLKEALIYYYNKTHRRITIEYIMLNKVNDSIEDAKALVNYVKDLNCYINLIPYNTTNASDFERSSDKNIKQFYDYLIKNKLTATVRKEFGSKISAACGQLSSMAEK